MATSLSPGEVKVQEQVQNTRLCPDREEHGLYSMVATLERVVGSPPPSAHRNPDGDVQPWCYVPETEEGIYWRYCDIPTCHSE